MAQEGMLYHVPGSGGGVFTEADLRAVKTIRHSGSEMDRSFDEFLAGIPRSPSDATELALLILEQKEDKVIQASSDLGVWRHDYQLLNREILAMQIQFVQRDTTGWDNPLTPHARNLVWVHKSFGLEPLREGSYGNCFGCGKLLNDEGIMLSFGQEGPWTWCRSCVGESRDALDHIFKADW